MSIDEQQDEPFDAEDTDGAVQTDTEVPARRSNAAQSASVSRRTTPRQFLHEVNVEMRKVVWPSRAETINYASVVLVTLIVVGALIFGLDLAFTRVAHFLFT